MIVYKVVEQISTSFKSARINHSKYNLLYQVNKVTKAKENTLGIFVFKRLKDARAFRQNNEKILRAETIGRGKTPKKIARFALNNFYNFRAQDILDIAIMSPPAGTICYPAIRPISLINTTQEK